MSSLNMSMLRREFLVWTGKPRRLAAARHTGYSGGGYGSSWNVVEG